MSAFGRLASAGAGAFGDARRIQQEQDAREEQQRQRQLQMAAMEMGLRQEGVVRRKTPVPTVESAVPVRQRYEPLGDSEYSIDLDNTPSAKQQAVESVKQQKQEEIIRQRIASMRALNPIYKDQPDDVLRPIASDPEAYRDSLKPPERKPWQPGSKAEYLEVHPRTPPGATTGKRVPATLLQAYNANRQQLTALDNAILEVQSNPQATGLLRGRSDDLDQRVDSSGVKARAAIADIGSMILHDRTGATVTAGEWPRLAPFIPRTTDTHETVLKKLRRMKEIAAQETAYLSEQVGDKTAATSGSPSSGNVSDVAIEDMIRRHGGR